MVYWLVAQYNLGQVVKLKKGHPCGENRWKIIRMGMDFRLKCLKCGRSILMPRSRFERRVKEIVEDVSE